MLRELRINNLAIIKELEIEIDEGLISITGETGAGKSIILDAISLLIGERNNADMLRNGETQMIAEGVFVLNDNQIKKLNDLEYDIEDEELIIRRIYDISGKSKVTINGRRSTTSLLKDIMKNILDLVGQHEHQSLLDNKQHLGLLDKFLNNDDMLIKREIKEIVKEIKEISNNIAIIEVEKQRIMDKKELYLFQSNEIEDMELEIDEDIELEEEYNILFNAGTIGERLEEAAELLTGSDNISNMLKKAAKNIEYIKDYSDTFEDLYVELEEIRNSIYNIGESINRELFDIEADDFRLNEVMERLNKINKIKVKYGDTIEEVLKYKEEIDKKLEYISFENKELDILLSKKEEKIKEYNEKVIVLRKARKNISKILSEEINKELRELNMENATFDIKFKELEGINSNGLDNIEFMIKSNVGEDYKGLAKIASGGEISRIMLALKIVFSKVDNISTLIFDEIDTGISGETVVRVADKLKRLSKYVQIICVTHSPQISAKSSQQYFVYKVVENDKTETKIKILNEEERVEEIAKMISGNKITKTSLEHVREMMREV